MSPVAVCVSYSVATFQYSTPSGSEKARNVGLVGIPEIASWFADRKIPESVLIRNQIGRGKAYFPQTECEQGCIMFPYFRGGEVINIKYRTRDKMFRLAQGAERIL